MFDSESESPIWSDQDFGFFEAFPDPFDLQNEAEDIGKMIISFTDMSPLNPVCEC